MSKDHRITIDGCSAFIFTSSILGLGLFRLDQKSRQLEAALSLLKLMEELQVPTGKSKERIGIGIGSKNWGKHQVFQRFCVCFSRPVFYD